MINLKTIGILTLIAMSVSSACAEEQIMTDKKLLEMEVKELKDKCADPAGCDGSDFKQLEETKTVLDSLSETFNFGVAIGFENYKSPFIQEVETLGEERIVRIVDQQDFKPSIWLETHYVWDQWAINRGFSHSAPGFYVGARLIGPDSDIFEAFSLGVMWSFKRTGLQNKSAPDQIADSINIGFGPVWHKTNALAAGIVEGEPLPQQYNEVKLDSRDEVTWMLMVSAGF